MCAAESQINGESLLDAAGRSSRMRFPYQISWVNNDGHERNGARGAEEYVRVVQVYEDSRSGRWVQDGDKASEGG